MRETVASRPEQWTNRASLQERGSAKGYGEDTEWREPSVHGFAKIGYRRG